MERPVRSTRGVRTTPLTEEEQRLENAVYSQLFGDAGEREEEDEDEDSSIAPADMFASMSKEDKAQLNCMKYPFARAMHYFYDLEKYPRLGATYVEDIHPFGTFHDDKLLETYKTENLINRKYAGLPRRLPGAHPRDKNSCHEYLFRNEDRKWRLDQQLYELKYLQRHPEVLSTDKPRHYHHLKRDIELAPLCQPDVSLAEKLELLNSKVEFLEARKRKQHEDVFCEDEFFFHVSRDQRFFDELEAQEASFDVQHIIVEAICSSVLSFNESPEDHVLKSEIESRFSLFSTLHKEDAEVVHPMYAEECAKYLATDNYEVYFLPSYLMGFGDEARLNWVGQVAGVRIMEHSGVDAFDVFRTAWKKLFGAELVLHDEFAKVERWEYVEAIKSLAKHEHKEATTAQPSLPKLPEPIAKHLNYFQQQEHVPTLSVKEYLVLYLVYYLYERAGFSKLDYRLVGSPLFDKYQYVLLERLGKTVVNFELSLKKLAEVVSENIEDSEVPVIIKSEYLPAEKLMVIWIEGKDVVDVEEFSNEEEGEEGDEDSGGDQQQEGSDEQEQQQEESQEEESPSPPPPPQGSLGEFPSKRRRFT